MHIDHLLTYLQDFITPARKKKFQKILATRTDHFTLAVEDLFQAHNTSAVIRSCDVFGLQSAHVIEKRFATSLDSQIAMGAQKWVDVHRHNTTMGCITDLKNKGYQIIATTPHYNDTTLEQFDISKKSAFFFGTERKGLSKEVLDHADGFLKIPMVGFTESLNISVSAAIIVQYVTHALRESTVDWQLTPAYKKQIELHWTKQSVRSIADVLTRYKVLYPKQAALLEKELDIV